MNKRATATKTVQKIRKQPQQLSTSSDIDMSCGCQILNDTSLTNISDTDCSCSQCMQANLNAFNQFKQQQKINQRKTIQSVNKKETNIESRNQNNLKQNNKFSNSYNRNSSLDVNRKTVIKNNSSKRPINQNNQIQMNEYQTYNIQKQEKYTSQNLNDYIMITKQRTKKYLQERKKLQQKDKQQKQHLKKKIKENLEILKYTAKAINSQQKNDENNVLPSYKWNHNPLRNQNIQNIKKEIKISRDQEREICCHKNKHIKNLDTNLKEFNPQFVSKRDQILKEVKQKRLQNLKQPDGCPHDHCPNHHMRTSPTKIKKIQKFIAKQVQKYKKQKKTQQLKKLEQQKANKAKLRAIDLKCKDIVSRSKKYDPSDSRTSFQLSVDHFSTFSAIKINKAQKDLMKKQKKLIKQQMNQRGGHFQQAIYQDLDEDDNMFKPSTNIKIQQKPDKQNQQNQRKQYCERIIKDAKIHSPRKLKQQDAQHKKLKQQKKKKQSMNLMEQQTKRKEVQLQIQRKKRQLMNEYKKQKQLNSSKNQKIKQQYSNYLNKSSKNVTQIQDIPIKQSRKIVTSKQL